VTRGRLDLGSNQLHLRPRYLEEGLNHGSHGDRHITLAKLPATRRNRVRLTVGCRRGVQVCCTS